MHAKRIDPGTRALCRLRMIKDDIRFYLSNHTILMNSDWEGCVRTDIRYAGNDLKGPKPDSWLTDALQFIGTMAKVDGGISEGCKQANPGEAWRCLCTTDTNYQLTNWLPSFTRNHHLT